MGKLVRDKIPDIVQQSGRTPRVMRLSADAYREALLDKLREEVVELTTAQTAESLLDEAADVLEVLTAIIVDRGIVFDSLVEAAAEKRAERGGFEMRLWLDTADADLSEL